MPFIISIKKINPKKVVTKNLRLHIMYYETKRPSWILILDGFLIGMSLNFFSFWLCCIKLIDFRKYQNNEIFYWYSVAKKEKKYRLFEVNRGYGGFLETFSREKVSIIPHSFTNDTVQTLYRILN